MELVALLEAQVDERVLHAGEERELRAAGDLQDMDGGEDQAGGKADAEGVDRLQPAEEAAHRQSVHQGEGSTPGARARSVARFPLALNPSKLRAAMASSVTYRGSGVDIDEGDALVERIKPHARRTMRPEVLAGIGGFAGLFEIPKKYREPVLVAGTDGVGTKLKLAFMAGKHDTVGIDLVAMSANDVVVCGAEPLIFLDYFATSKLKAAEAEQVIKGIAEGCARAGCALIGGETAELPGFYQGGEYDLAGFCVGVVEKSRILDGAQVKAGDVVLGLASSGLHSNGFSLARKVLERELTPELARDLLEPTRIYVKDCLALREAVQVHAFAHITGGGLPGNLPRVLPRGHRAVLRRGSWPVPPVFDRIQRAGNVAPDEMLRTFNLGVGMCAVVGKSDAASALELLRARGQPACEIGVIEAAPQLAEPEVVVQ